MPSTLDINYTKEVCFPCKWFSRQLLISGQNPKYQTSCSYPSVVADDLGLIRGKGKTINIGHGDPSRPQWCPIRGNAEAEQEAEGG